MLSTQSIDHYAGKLRTAARVALASIVLALALAYADPAHAQTPTLSFTVQTTTTGGAVTPKLTWATTPAASACTASGATDWTGTKPAQGTATLAAITATKSYTLVCNWAASQTAKLTWTAPTTHTDGTPYDDPGGYRVHYGKTSAVSDQTLYLNGPESRTWTSPALAAGDWWFGVRAVSATGLESDLSPVVKKTITASASQTRTLEVAVRFPAAPTGVAVE